MSDLIYVERKKDSDCLKIIWDEIVKKGLELPYHSKSIVIIK